MSDDRRPGDGHIETAETDLHRASLSPQYPNSRNRDAAPGAASSHATDADIAFMRKAIALAMKGRGTVEPNPMVGCVLVKGGEVIGQAFHVKPGTPHAEPLAIASCTTDPAGATAYVTLEPCCHHNKRTPPCVPALIEAGVARVVIGAIDPNPDVNGNGIAQLEVAGIDVTAGVLEDECRQLLAPFAAHVLHGRPYVTLKWAQTADGKIAGPGGKRMQISHEAVMKIVHQLRADSDAILVGINTVGRDDPLLTARGVPTVRQLLRAVYDPRLEISLDSRLMKTVDQFPLAVYCSAAAYHERALDKRKLLEARGVRVICVESTGEPTADPADAKRLSLTDILLDLGGQGVTHLLVEPGPGLAGYFIRQNKADRAWVLTSPRRVDDATAPAATPLPPEFIATGQTTVATDCITEYLNTRSDLFAAVARSADFVRIS